MIANGFAPRSGRGPVGFAISVVLIHLAVSLVHGFAHSRLGIGLTVAQQIFIGTVITVAPLVAAYLLWRNKLRVGGALLAASMAGALAFGVFHHFFAPGADNVNHQFLDAPAIWMTLFDRTAWGFALLEALGVILGLVLFLKDYRTK